MNLDYKPSNIVGFSIISFKDKDSLSDYLLYNQT